MAGAVYWIGADGNTYLKGVNGVKNLGRTSGNSAKGFNTATAEYQANQIADPNPPRQSSPAPSSPNGSTFSAPTFADKSNDISLQNAGLAAVDQQTTTGLDAISKTLDNIKGGYKTEADANEGDYKLSSDTNQSNLQKNKQTAYVNAAAGRQGLSGTLASIGALNGSGLVLRDRAVQAGANADLAGADNNFATNQSGLDTAIGTFRRQNDQRNKDADIAGENARQTVQNNAASNRLTAYKNLADDYTAQGQGDEAAKYTALAAALFPTIASTSIPQIPLAAQGAAYTPASLASYIAGSNPTTVAITPANGTQAPGLSVVPVKKKQLATA